MNKYQKALEYLKEYGYENLKNYDAYQDNFQPMDTSIYQADDEYCKQIDLLQELLNALGSVLDNTDEA